MPGEQGIHVVADPIAEFVGDDTHAVQWGEKQVIFMGPSFLNVVDCVISTPPRRNDLAARIRTPTEEGCAQAWERG